MQSENMESLTANEQTSILKVIYELIENYPLLNGMKVNFDEVDIDISNIGILSSSGSKVLSRDILGGFKGLLPFTLAWGGIPTTSKRKINVVEILNSIGNWLNKQTIKDSKGNEYKLEEYPALSGNRKIETIEQTTVPHISGVADNGNVKYECMIHVTYVKEE